MENNSPTMSHSKMQRTGGAGERGSELKDETPSKNITIRINESGLKGTDVLSLNEDIEM